MFNILVEQEFKGRFKNTALGYFWHLLNPLSQIIIYLIVFSMIFGKDIPNYWVYISTGMFAYSFFSTCCTNGSKAIITNSNMITKMTFAKETLIFSKVGSAFITLSISYGVLIILMLIFRAKLSAYMLILPIVLILLVIFCTGLALLLSAITVYLRDISNAISIILGCFMFTLPIVYSIEKIQLNPILGAFSTINPMYYFINVIHDIFYTGICPNILDLVICLLFSISFLIVGMYIFKKLENGFAERL